MEQDSVVYSAPTAADVVPDIPVSPADSENITHDQAVAALTAHEQRILHRNRRRATVGDLIGAEAVAEIDAARRAAAEVASHDPAVIAQRQRAAKALRRLYSVDL